jgi:hypothetical protein
VLGDLPTPEPSPAAWALLESRLLAEGLMRSAPAAQPQLHTPRRLLRIAASLSLFLVGGAAGALAWQRLAAPAQQQVAAVIDPIVVPAPALGGTAPEAPAPRAEPAPASGVRLAGNTTGPRPRPQARPRSVPSSPAVRQAERELASAESAYLAALRRYAELADPASGADPQTRLEALDRLVEMSARALDRAPDDPQLNGYHLAALNERDALRRRLERAAETTWF